MRRKLTMPARGASYIKYPFGEMEIDDYFVVPPELLHKVRPAASQYGKRNGLAFSVTTRHDGKAVCIRLG